MDELQQLKIDLRGQEETERSCRFQLDDKYFGSLDGSQIAHGNVELLLNIRKMADVYELTFQLAGEVTVSCDRCLEDMQQPVVANHKLMVKLGQACDEGDDTVTVDAEEGVIDVAWTVYEYIMLSVPLQHFHEPGQCNAAMTSKLDELSRTSTEQSIDPRWEALKQLTAKRKE